MPFELEINIIDPLRDFDTYPILKYCVSAEPFSDQPVEIAMNWLKECISSHTACSERHQKTIPSRLIDLGDYTDSQGVRLIETSKLSDPNIEYATLSHCWGRVERTTTQKCNFDSMRQGIKISELSPTFSDAVKVAQSLKIRYIWIDSICIIQDSIEDWTRESAKMAGIFANSFLTIACPSSTNSQEGFLSPRLHGRYFVQLDEPLSHLYMRKSLQGFQEEIRNSPLDRRAWVFQEMQLSRRVLFYTKDQMFWECRQWCAQEDADYHYDRNLHEQNRSLCHGQQEMMEYFKKKKRPQYGGYNGHDDRSHLVRGKWYWLLDQYSEKISTYQIDKLPALSAIAQEIQRLTGHTYLAGLWKEDLITGLLWQRRLVTNWMEPKHELRDLNLIDEAGTPSWSWAAYDGSQVSSSHGYSLESGILEDLVTIKYASVEMVDNNYPTGRVKGGIIEIAGLSQIILPNKDTDRYPPTLDISGDNVGNWDRNMALDGQLRVTVTFDLAEERDSNRPALCLPLRGVNCYYKFEDGMQKVYSRDCLVLRPSGSDVGKYKRVGVGSIIKKTIDSSKDTGWELKTRQLSEYSFYINTQSKLHRNLSPISGSRLKYDLNH